MTMTKEDFNQMAWASSRHPQNRHKAKRNNKYRDAIIADIYFFGAGVMFFVISMICVLAS